MNFKILSVMLSLVISSAAFASGVGTVPCTSASGPTTFFNQGGLVLTSECLNVNGPSSTPVYGQLVVFNAEVAIPSYYTNRGAILFQCIRNVTNVQMSASNIVTMEAHNCDGSVTNFIMSLDQIREMIIKSADGDYQRNYPGYNG